MSRGIRRFIRLVSPVSLISVIGRSVDKADRLLVDEWDDRNLLYSLRFDLGAAVVVPGSDLRQV